MPLLRPLLRLLLAVATVTLLLRGLVVWRMLVVLQTKSHHSGPARATHTAAA